MFKSDLRWTINDLVSYLFFWSQSHWDMGCHSLESHVQETLYIPDSSLYSRFHSMLVWIWLKDFKLKVNGLYREQCVGSLSQNNKTYTIVQVHLYTALYCRLCFIFPICLILQNVSLQHIDICQTTLQRMVWPFHGQENLMLLRKDIHEKEWYYIFLSFFLFF